VSRVVGRKAVVRRRRGVLAIALLVMLATILAYTLVPSGPVLTPFQARMVRLAEGQVGYRTDPTDSYCNRFSAFWGVGAGGCPVGERSEEWCADFAAWVWREAGARFSYGFGPSEIDGAAASFYTWAVAHHRWHPASSGYVAQAGDVAVYGLDLATMTAEHVAVVTSDPSGQRGPDVVNGDGSRTGFSVVEVGIDQYKVDNHGDGGVLAGYAVPLPPRSPRRPRSVSHGR